MEIICHTCSTNAQNYFCPELTFEKLLERDQELRLRDLAGHADGGRLQDHVAGGRQVLQEPELFVRRGADDLRLRNLLLLLGFL
jgi:hypothetical protein